MDKHKQVEKGLCLRLNQDQNKVYPCRVPNLLCKFYQWRFSFLHLAQLHVSGGLSVKEKDDFSDDNVGSQSTAIAKVEAGLHWVVSQ